MPDTSHCCCGGGCTNCPTITVTVTDSASGAALRWARVHVYCGETLLFSQVTNASGQTTIVGLCCAGAGHMRVCRLCYEPQTIAFTACPSTAVNVSLVKATSKPSHWVTNDYPGADPGTPKFYIELAYTLITPADGSPAYYAWVGCGPVVLEVLQFTGAGCTPAGSAVEAVSVSFVLSCSYTTAGNAGGLTANWLSSLLTGGPAFPPADFTGCFDWGADAVTYDGSFGTTSIYGVSTDPDCLPVLAGPGVIGPFATCEYADGLTFNLSGIGTVMLTTTDPTP